MTPSDERLKWLIEFLDAYKSEDFAAYEFGHYGMPSKTARLKQWEVLKIADDLKQFIAGPGLKCSVRMDDGEPVPLEDVEMGIDRIYQCRAALDIGSGLFTEKGPAMKQPPTLGKKWSFKNDGYKHLFSLLPGATEAMGPLVVPPDVRIGYDRSFPHSIVAHGKLEDLALLSLVFTLKETGTDKIAQCLECPRLFFKVRAKQKYCSKTCINRVSRREWLKKPENRVKESESAHRRYKRRVQQGRNIKVKPRPRSKSKGNE